MKRVRRRCSGYTAVELLVVLMILAVGSVSILPPIDLARETANQDAAMTGLLAIAHGEQIFRSSDSDGDGVDDYGNLGELAAAGLIPAALSDGEDRGYAFPVTTGAGPSFEARANPLSCHTGALRLYVDASGIVRFDEAHPAGPGDPPLPPDGQLQIPDTTEQVACVETVDTGIRQAVMAALGLAPGVTPDQAIALAGTPGVIDSVTTRLDADANEQLELGEYTSGDWLAVAQAIAAELGDAGPALGDDADLTALVDARQTWLADELDLDLDPPQPSAALLDLYGRQDDVVAYFASLQAAVPALGRSALAALAAGLVIAAGLARRARP
jgi:prepilin-type N-terminal cleavage/methylation domain-containing protein